MEKEKSNTAIQQEVDVTEEEWQMEWKRLRKNARRKKSTNKCRNQSYQRRKRIELLY